MAYLMTVNLGRFDPSSAAGDAVGLSLALGMD